MSEFLDAAAQVVGAPAELVLRSAEARAAADGVSVDEILQAWAGGDSAPAPSPAPAPAAAPAAPPPPPEPAAPPPPAPAAPPPSPTPAASPAPVAPAPAAPAAPLVAEGPPPVLTGRVDRPFRYLFGATTLLVLCLVVTLVLPAFSGTSRGAVHSEIPYTANALRGQEVYLTEGCAGCHTQMVRPVVADAQLAALAGVGGSDAARHQPGDRPPALRSRPGQRGESNDPDRDRGDPLRRRWTPHLWRRLDGLLGGLPVGVPGPDRERTR